MPKEIFLCAISNISSGSCLEDCGFCTQSLAHHADIQRYKYKKIPTIVAEAKRAKANGAIGFCLVTSGKGLDDTKLSFVCEAAQAIQKECDELNLIACNGLASLEQLKTLKKAGITLYNHNLESSKNFYNTLCSTHTWEERYATCLHAKEAGLHLISGGIFGLGESDEDRASFVQSIKSLDPFTIPLNFFHPNPALPIKTTPMDEDHALTLVRYVKAAIPQARLMIAGGREITFTKHPGAIFEAGADAIVIGDYLTTAGDTPSHDKLMIQEAGYTIATYCHE
ncbi:biotin synthase [Sulfurospirillum sp. 1612]|uniref:biotin synthase n=1 Tax=Sulfurospirillum sp. 1612 TaxID=3094835 RepID=UPI002F9547F8